MHLAVCTYYIDHAFLGQTHPSECEILSLTSEWNWYLQRLGCRTGCLDFLWVLWNIELFSIALAWCVLLSSKKNCLNRLSRSRSFSKIQNLRPSRSPLLPQLIVWIVQCKTTASLSFLEWSRSMQLLSLASFSEKWSGKWTSRRSPSMT